MLFFYIFRFSPVFVKLNRLFLLLLLHKLLCWKFLLTLAIKCKFSAALFKLFLQCVYIQIFQLAQLEGNCGIFCGLILLKKWKMMFFSLLLKTRWGINTKKYKEKVVETLTVQDKAFFVFMMFIGIALILSFRNK